MTLRRRSKAIENLRLENLRDYIITEDEPDLSPLTIRPTTSRPFPRRVNNDTYEDIMASFQKFTWETPQIDGVVLYDYTRFVEAMKLPTREAVEPWLVWVQAHLGWEARWILENPVAVKREVMRRFEGDEPTRGYITPRRVMGEEDSQLREISSGESIDERRRGAQSRIGIREEEVAETKRSSSSLGWRFKGIPPSRPQSALGFSEVKMLKRHFTSLKRKALTNPWQRRTHTTTK